MYSWQWRLAVLVNAFASCSKIKKKDVPAMTSCKRPARNASNDARPFKPCKSIKGIKMRDQGRLVEWFDEKVTALFSRMMLKKSESFAYQRFCTPWTSANYWLCTGISGNPRRTRPFSCSAGHVFKGISNP